MSLSFNRRRFLSAGSLTAAAVLFAGAFALPRAALAEPVMGDIPLGDPDAPVTVIEYASFTCPHCGNFAKDTWPKVKAQYVETGKVRFILRDVYFDKYGLWASMVARCGGENAFYPIADALLSKQDVWLKVPEDQIGQEIAKIGRLNGLTSAELNACLSDQDYAKALIARYQETAAEDEVTSTPTFIINGKKETGNMPFEQFAQLLEAEL